MVAKVRLGGSFGNSVRYLMEGRKTEDQQMVEKHAEVLAANGIRLGSLTHMSADFTRQHALNPDLKRAVWHVALSFSRDDESQLTNTRMAELAKLYMRRLGVDPTQAQWLLVRHSDREHPHMHLLLNRVKQNGGTIDAGFCQSRSRSVAIAIAHEQGLTLSVSRPTAKKVSHQQNESAWRTAKRIIYKALAQELSHSASLIGLANRLEQYEIQVHRYPAKAESDESTTGVVFEHNGQFVKASQADRGFSWPKMKNKLTQQRQLGIQDLPKLGLSLTTSPKPVKQPTINQPLANKSETDAILPTKATQLNKSRFKINRGR
ncbi:relaxase/mobilization nuclease domain-containing protein [Spirosoma endophyticum]|uniref:Relaxase/Mobilisation nuclease domain-containing protein n=1 Tax=Spirosoma endophyticum TaxID=662367 RepID=A0A1I1QME1_9BACT|nr:relaxase/mobilization nuclease domain-containing protein [Spirosoma endophyticum]SFD23294.1 Relaxase/Mobilisation nuclease domain-containing protein [Spirosoma endophyticum]